MIEKAVSENEPLVTVYSKQGCGGCVFTKSFLNKHGIEYREIRVDQQPEAVEEIKLNGFQSLPVVTVGSFDNAWSGYNPERLQGLLEE